MAYFIVLWHRLLLKDMHMYRNQNQGRKKNRKKQNVKYRGMQSAGRQNKKVNPG
jgi:hypothetical protein